MTLMTLMYTHGGEKVVFKEYTYLKALRQGLHTHDDFVVSLFYVCLCIYICG